VFDSFRRPLSNSEILPLLLNHRRSVRACFYDIRQHGSSEDLALAWECLLAVGYADREMASSYLAAVPPAKLGTRQQIPSPVKSPIAQQKTLNIQGLLPSVRGGFYFGTMFLCGLAGPHKENTS
jgi:hypothetical protein